MKKCVHWDTPMWKVIRERLRSITDADTPYIFIEGKLEHEIWYAVGSMIVQKMSAEPY